nr:hypothetical protein [Tanacetum cinerariifolium]
MRAISEQFVNMAYGFFLGKRVANLVDANYVRNTWGKYGLVKSMLNSSTGLFLFQFSSMDGLDSILENEPWFIRNNPLILKKWNPDVNLLKKDVNILVWVKLHGVHVTAFSEDGRSSYARAMIELRADVKLKDTIVVAMPKLIGEGFYTCDVRVEYGWKPPRCACCKVFGNVQDECPYNLGSDVVKKPNQAPKGVPIGLVMGFKPAKHMYRPIKNNFEGDGYILNTIRIEYEWEPPRCEVCMVFGHDEVTCPKRVVDEPKKQNGKYNDGFQQAPKVTLCGINMSPKLQFKATKQVYRLISKTNNASIKGMKKNAQTTRQETTSSNPFDALTMVENDDELGKNKESDLVDEESKSEVEDVYDESTSLMTFKSRGETMSVEKMIMIITYMMMMMMMMNVKISRKSN